MVIYVLQVLYDPLYLSATPSGETPGPQGTPISVVSEWGIPQWFVFRGVNYTQTGVGNPGRAYYLAAGFDGSGADAMVADVPASSHTPGSPVQLWSENGGRNQLWTMIPVGAGGIPVGGGYFYLRNVESGLVLDVPAYSKQPGTAVQQWTLNFGSNQTWIPLVQEAGDPPRYTFMVAPLGVDQNGTHLRFTGTLHQPNSQGQVFLINAPGPDYTSTASAFTEVFQIDGNGSFSIDAAKFLETGVVIHQNAMAVLEDGQGYVSALFQIPQSWLVTGS